MTNTDTADADATALQVARLAHAGLAARAGDRQHGRGRGRRPGDGPQAPTTSASTCPVIGDFHYNGHKLLVDHPEMAAALDKYRINPGNVGRSTTTSNFQTIVRAAIEHDKPVRIGVNWGSLDQQLLTELMEANARLAEPRDARDVMIDAMVESAMRSAELAEETGLRHDRIILSAKVSRRPRPRRHVPPAGAALRLPAPPRPDRGRAWAMKGIVASTAGPRLLLNEGIGDTIRVSLTPEPGAGRELEVEVAQQVLQSLGLRSFLPQVSACPGCGRTTSTFFQEMARTSPTTSRTGCPSGARRTPASRR